MTTQSLPSPTTVIDSVPRSQDAIRRAEAAFPRVLVLMPLAAAVALFVHQAVPNRQTNIPTHLYPVFLKFSVAIGVLISAVYIAFPWIRKPTAKHPRSQFATPTTIWTRARSRHTRLAPLVAAALLVLCGWDLLTLKLALVPLPYFPGPDMVLQSLRDDWQLLLTCTWHSLLLLFTGYALGATMGVICGVLIGWYSTWRYWGMPILKLIGPIPATAFIPLALMLFPSAFTSAMALIALAVWFPLTMLTASGIANVRISFLDVARTLGAGRGFLIFRVAIPAALPSIFVGLFMGLGASFLTLIVAETVGVSSGLGWYINWAKAWADYPKVYAALVIMAVFFSGIMTLLFKLRDRVLIYQKGTIKW
jgi:NitT/TauT family transport system permease protein